jgi:hypothetical protein
LKLTEWDRKCLTFAGQRLIKDGFTKEADALLNLASQAAATPQDSEYMTAYERECQDTMAEGIKYWKDKAAAVAVGEPMTQTAALEFIDQFEIVGDNNDSRDPTDEEKFILREFILQLFDDATPPAPIASAEQAVPVAALTVWYGSMPESNGKTNWTAILHNGDMASGMTIDRSEYPDRVRYAADRVRWLIGDLDKEPWILDYDADKHSGYTHPAAAQPARAEVLEDFPDEVLAAIDQRAAEITDDWAERQPIEPSKMTCDARFIREVLRLVRIQL